mgnify:CR=1 FL=1
MCLTSLSFFLVSSGVIIVKPRSFTMLIAFSTNCAFVASFPFDKYKLSSSPTLIPLLSNVFTNLSKSSFDLSIES